MMSFILSFVGTLLIIALIGWLIYAIANKQPSLRWIIVAIVIILIIGTLWILRGTFVDISHSLSSPSLKTVNTFTQNYWFWILLASGIASMIIATLFPKGKETVAKTLQSAIAVIVFALFIGFPIIGWLTGTAEHNSPQQSERIQTLCPDASALETRSCIVTTEWTNWIKPAEGTVNNGMYLRYNPQELVICECKVENGTSFYRFRAKENQVVLSYRFVQASQLHLKKLL
ncbi:MAG: hypothetical protein NTY93_03025 [Candidatus Kaiserbacteria bacterium]|nr:hypothetical protein [Candidatus Kaiserbacteria bacterium]